MCQRYHPPIVKSLGSFGTAHVTFYSNTHFISSQHRLHHMPMHVREAELAALKTEGEAFVADAEHGEVVMETSKFPEGVMGNPGAALSRELD